MTRTLLLAFLLALPAAAAAGRDCSAPAAVCEAPGAGSLALVAGGVPLQVLVDVDDFPAVHLAAEALRADLAAVSGAVAASASRPARTP